MANKFSNHSIAQLHTLHPDLQRICRDLLPFHDFKILEGHRNRNKQEEAYKMRHSKVRWPNSKHNTSPSEAMDLLPFVNGRFIGWHDWKQWRYFGGMVMGAAAILRKNGEIESRLRWGHDWDKDNDLDDQKFIDAPHFEILN